MNAVINGAKWVCLLFLRLKFNKLEKRCKKMILPIYLAFSEILRT